MASNAALSSKGGGGASGECNCNELAVPHTHERSLLDSTIKSMVLGGAIELLPVVKDLVGHQVSDSVHLMLLFSNIRYSHCYLPQELVSIHLVRGRGVS
jgi:hypothetical protein